MSGFKVRDNLSWCGLHERRYRPLILSESSSSCLDATTLQVPSVPHGCMMMQILPVYQQRIQKGSCGSRSRWPQLPNTNGIVEYAWLHVPHVSAQSLCKRIACWDHEHIPIGYPTGCPDHSLHKTPMPNTSMIICP